MTIDISGPLAEKIDSLIAEITRLRSRVELLERKGNPAKILRRKEAAASLGISPSSLDRAIKAGDLRAVIHPFGGVGIEPGELERYIERARGARPRLHA